MNIQNLSKKAAVTGIVALSMIVGGAGATALNAIAAHAQTTTTTPTVVTAQTAPAASTTPTIDNGTPSGTFHSNEDPTHEKSESAAREAQEDAGQRPTGK